MRNKSIFVWVVLFIVPAFAGRAAAQGKFSIGVSQLMEINSWLANANQGLVVERHLNEKYALELGVFYRNTTTEWLVSTTSYSLNAKVRRDYVWIPVLAKRYGKILNVSAGTTFERFVGWKDMTTDPGLDVTRYELSDKNTYSLMAKVGHSFKVGRRFVLEPEAAFNWMLDVEDEYFGFGLCAKYRL